MNTISVHASHISKHKILEMFKLHGLKVQKLNAYNCLVEFIHPPTVYCLIEFPMPPENCPEGWYGINQIPMYFVYHMEMDEFDEYPRIFGKVLTDKDFEHWLSLDSLSEVQSEIKMFCEHLLNNPPDYPFPDYDIPDCSFSDDDSGNELPF